MTTKSAATAPTQEQWIIVTNFRSGDKAYWGETRDRVSGLTPYIGNAHRYESRNAALHEGYGYKECRRFHDFTVEQLPPKPPLVGDHKPYRGRG